MSKKITLNADILPEKPIVFKAKDFSNRAELEQVIISQLGRNIDSNKYHQIKGTKRQLKKLSLSNSTSIWGVKCKTTK